ncbi:MAG: ATP-binding cassette domain-containing protein [Burkholderiaceae bacterium]
MTTGTAQTLSLRDVRIALPERELIRHLSIDIAPGQVVTVMGASGSGKSSLLAYIGGFLHAPFVATGEVSIGAHRLNDAPPHARRAGILFQDALLFPHLSAAGNLLFGMPASRLSRAARRRLVNEALSDAGLEGYGERDPATLSGGQRARVALLRTLLSEPQLLLLDEPFGKLDAALREDFRHFVFAHARRLGLPTLMVTHDAADAEAAGGPVVVLE